MLAVKLDKIKLKYIMYFTVILLFLFTGVMIKIIQDNSKCNNNPFQYGARIMQDKNNLTLLCSCDVLEGSNVQRFYFDSQGTYKKNPLEHQGLVLSP